MYGYGKGGQKETLKRQCLQHQKKRHTISKQLVHVCSSLQSITNFFLGDICDNKKYAMSENSRAGGIRPWGTMKNYLAKGITYEIFCDYKRNAQIAPECGEFIFSTLHKGGPRRYHATRTEIC